MLSITFHFHFGEWLLIIALRATLALNLNYPYSEILKTKNTLIWHWQFKSLPTINKYRKVSKLLKDELVTIAVQIMQKTLAAPFWSCLWLTSGYPNLHGMIAMLLNNQFSEKRKKTLRYIINIHYQHINHISTSII